MRLTGSAILVVDPDALNRLEVARVIGRIYPECEARCAMDAMDAIGKLDERVVAIVCDLGGVGWNGLSLCEWLRDDAQGSPVTRAPFILLVPRKLSEPEEVCAWQVGVSCILSRPIDIHAFARALARATGEVPKWPPSAASCEDRLAERAL